MKKKLDCILLIDDSESTNFINSYIIEQNDCSDKVIAVESGSEALELISSNKDKGLKQPDLIFLDINMPGVDGWEFLDSYKDLNLKSAPIIIMLSTSVNPNDAIRAEKIDEVSNFKSKPLTDEIITEVLTTHFTS